MSRCAFPVPPSPTASDSGHDLAAGGRPSRIPKRASVEQFGRRASTRSSLSQISQPSSSFSSVDELVRIQTAQVGSKRMTVWVIAVPDPTCHVPPP